MDMKRFTEKSREALTATQQLTASRYHQEMTGKHLLAALLTQEEGIPRFLEHAGVNTDLLIAKTEDLLKKIPVVRGYQ